MNSWRLTTKSGRVYAYGPTLGMPINKMVMDGVDQPYIDTKFKHRTCQHSPRKKTTWGLGPTTTIACDQLPQPLKLLTAVSCLHGLGPQLPHELVDESLQLCHGLIKLFLPSQLHGYLCFFQGANSWVWLKKLYLDSTGDFFNSTVRLKPIETDEKMPHLKLGSWGGPPVIRPSPRGADVAQSPGELWGKCGAYGHPNFQLSVCRMNLFI